MKILYVEDEIAHVELTQRTLEDNLKDRFVLYHVDSIRGALKMLALEPDIDLVLSDLRLPDGSGLDLLRRVKELQPSPAVVLVTGQGDEQVAVTALKNGAADYLVKEGDYLHRLPAAITNALAQSRLEREQMALRAAEQRFRVLVEQLPAAVYTSNHDDFSSALYVSPQIQEITGYSASEWLADPTFWLKQVHPEDVDRVLKEIRTTNQSLTDFNLDYRVLHRDGHIVWLRDVAKMIVDDTGQPRYWQGILFDITKEVESQAVLRASEERFRRIFHSTPIAACVVTLDEGHFIDANTTFLNLVGITLENLIGHTSQELGFWKSAQDRENFVLALKSQGSLKGVEVQYTNVPNGPRDTIAFYELIELSGTVCVLAMFYDVTEQKKTQKALQAERDFALQVLNNMGQGLTILDSDGRFEYVNPAYAGMMGRVIEEFPGKKPTDFTAEASQGRLQEERNLRKQGVKSTYESKLVHKDGHEVPVIITGVPRIQNGSHRGAISVITDLTSQKATERELERQVRELTVLHAVATAEAESKSEDEMIAKVTAIISQIYTQVCGILLLDETGQLLTPHPSYMGADITNWQNGYPITEGITGRAVSSGRIIRIGNVTEEPGYIEIASNILSELCVPIQVHNHTIGVINMESHSADAFSEHDEAFLITIASGLGTALERLRLFAEEQRRAQEAESLREATAALGTTLEFRPLLNAVLDTLKKIIPFDSASIFLRGDEDEDMEIVAVKGFNEPGKFIGRRIPKSEEWEELAQNKAAFILEDVQNDPLFEAWEGSENIRGWMGVPIVAQDRVIGFINLDSHRKNAFTERQGTTAQTFANSVAVAIQNSRLFESEKQRRQEAETLRQVATAISSTLELDAVVAEILEALRHVIPFESGSVFLLEGDQLRIAMASGYAHAEQLKDLTFPANDDLFVIMKNTRQPFIVNDVKTDPRFMQLGESTEIHSWMAVPLIARGKVIGYLTLDSRQTGAFDESIGDTALALAHQAAAAIENARLYDETQRRLDELEIINRISVSLRKAQSVQEMLPILLNEALLLMNTQHGSIWLYDPAANMLNQKIARGAEANLQYRSFVPGQGIVGHVFISGEKYTTPELKNDLLLFEGNKDSMASGLSGICLPIRSTLGSVGVLMIAIEMGRKLTGEINLLTILADVTGNAIHRAELFEQSQDQVRKLTTLRDIDSAIASSTDLRVTLNLLMDHTLKHLKTDAVDIMLYHSELQSLNFLCSMGFYSTSVSRPLMRLGEGLAGQVVMKGGIEQVPDLQNSSEAKRDPLLIREGFVTYFGVPLIVKGLIKGVFEVYHREPFSPSTDWMQFLQTLAGQAAIAIDNAQLFDNLQRSNVEIRQAYDTTLEGWARALELRDRETEGHTRRVTNLTMQLARYMGIPDEELIDIYRGVLLHDIGKMGVSDHILRKTGPLNESEWLEMRKHPEYAFDLLSPISYLRPALDIPYGHHEHWDGSGYPRGLKGEQIPLSARIFAIVDIWDALLSDRPYRKAWPRDRVIDYLRDISGKILDPNVVVAFLKMIGE